MTCDKTIRRGTVVYDVADARHHGIVRSLHLVDGNKFTASVKWIETGSCNRVPVTDLRRVTDETQDEPAPVPPLPPAVMPIPKIKDARYDGFPTRLTSNGEIWCLFSRYDQRSTGKWCIPSRSMQVYCYEAGVITEAEYHQMFGHDLPPLPDVAFCSGWFSPLL